MKRSDQVFCHDSNHTDQNYEWRQLTDIINILGVKDLANNGRYPRGTQSTRIDDITTSSNPS